MRIWLITVGEPLPTDGGNVRLLRTGILAGLLEAAGHDVVWWSSSLNHAAKTQRFPEYTTLKLGPRFEIKLLHAAGYTRNVSLRTIIHHHRTARKFAAAAGRFKFQTKINRRSQLYFVVANFDPTMIREISREF